MTGRLVRALVGLVAALAALAGAAGGAAAAPPAPAVPVPPPEGMVPVPPRTEHVLPCRPACAHVELRASDASPVGGDTVTYQLTGRNLRKQVTDSLWWPGDGSPTAAVPGSGSWTHTWPVSATAQT